LGVGSIGAIFVATEALTLPFVRGSGLAQADFELFLVSVLVGVPAIGVSIWGILLHRKQPTDEPRRYAATALAVANTIFVVSSGAFALLIRTFGFFWK
jgi:hypothetical protein